MPGFCTKETGATTRVAVWACVVALLVASSVQACHICGLALQANQHYSISTASPSAPAGSLCPICLSSQPANTPVAAVGLTPHFAVTPQNATPEEIFRPGEALFSLSIRPPPSL